MSVFEPMLHSQKVLVLCSHDVYRLTEHAESAVCRGARRGRQCIPGQQLLGPLESLIDMRRDIVLAHAFSQPAALQFVENLGLHP